MSQTAYRLCIRQMQEHLFWNLLTCEWRPRQQYFRIETDKTDKLSDMFMLNKFSSSDQLFVETMPWKKKVNGGVPVGKVSAY